MKPGWEELRHEEAGLALSYPVEWRCMRDVRGAPVTLLAPAGDSDFRASFVVTVEAAPAASDLDVIVRDVVRELDRFLTDYRNLTVEESEVAGRPARRLAGSYRSGRVTVSIEQWLVDGGQRLVSVTASYDGESEAAFGPTARDVVGTLRID